MKAGGKKKKPREILQSPSITCFVLNSIHKSNTDMKYETPVYYFVVESEKCRLLTYATLLYSVQDQFVFALTSVIQFVGASPTRLKGHRFNSQSGHIPRMQVRSLVKGCMRKQLINVSHIDASLSPFLSFYKQRKNVLR